MRHFLRTFLRVLTVDTPPTRQAQATYIILWVILLAWLAGGIAMFTSR